MSVICISVGILVRYSHIVGFAGKDVFVFGLVTVEVIMDLVLL